MAVMLYSINGPISGSSGWRIGRVQGVVREMRVMNEYRYLSTSCQYCTSIKRTVSVM